MNGYYYVYPMRPNEIFHYGLPERSGRYAWGSGDRPYQRLEKRAARMENRLRRGFEKTDEKTEKLQRKANKQFNKANIQRNSMFQFRRNRANESFDKGYDLQEKKARVEYRMSKKYEKYLNKFEKLEIRMDDDLKQKGLEYYNRVIANADTQYKAALMKRVN